MEVAHSNTVYPRYYRAHYAKNSLFELTWDNYLLLSPLVRVSETKTILHENLQLINTLKLLFTLYNVSPRVKVSSVVLLYVVCIPRSRGGKVTWDTAGQLDILQGEHLRGVVAHHSDQSWPLVTERSLGIPSHYWPHPTVYNCHWPSHHTCWLPGQRVHPTGYQGNVAIQLVSTGVYQSH